MDTVRDKMAITNMKNEDNVCFKWSVTRALNPVERNGERVTKLLKLQAEELDFKGVGFPTPCLGGVFEKFEEVNNISLFVFGHDERNIIPLYKLMRRYSFVVRRFLILP